MNARELTSDQIAQARLYDKVNGPFPYVANMSLVRKMIRRGETPPWFYMSSTQVRKFYALVESLKAPRIKTEKREVGRASLTRCGNGHEFTPENTYMYKGHRECRACRATHNKNSRIRSQKRDRIIARMRQQERLRAINEKRKQDNLLACQPNTP